MACSSSTDASGEGDADATHDDDTGARDDSAIAGDSAKSETSSGDGSIDGGSSDSPPACGILACDAAKTFYAPILEAYDRLGGAAQLGAPHDNGGTEYVHDWGAGKVQDFDGGAFGPSTIALETGKAKAWAVHGKIRDAWLRLGGAPGFGYPIEDEHAGPGGQVQRFAKGCIAPDGTGGDDGFTTCDPPPDLTPILKKIGDDAKTFAPGTQDAIGVLWLPTGARFSYAGDERHVSASSMKFVWAMAALDKNAIATVDTPALPTFKDSNNSTAGQLIDLAGGAVAVNDFTSKRLGIPVTALSLCHWNFDTTRNGTNCSSAMGGDNFFTPNSVLDFLSHAWKRDVVTGAKGDKLLEYATLSPRTGYGGWLGTQLPAAAQKTMNHKAGWLPPGCCSSDATYNNMNDIAIVRTPKGAYAIALLFAHAPDYWGAQQKSLEWASCVVYHALAVDVADPFSAGCTHP